MRILRERAHAKLNLYLDVAKGYGDGYHIVNSIMHAVNLYDTVIVGVNENGAGNITVSVKGNEDIPADGRNIAVIAARTFMINFGVNPDVKITIEKRIPVAAGLAGGSADAAATLRALNRIYGNPFGEKKLVELGGIVGSDVPFCCMGGTAHCCGRGDQIRRLPVSKKYNFVIAIGSERMSTAEAYHALDEMYSYFDETVIHGYGGTLYNTMDAMIDGELPAFPIYNIFESAVFPMCPEAKALKAELRALGAVTAMMSGSGPSVFGIFKSPAAAERACETLVSRGLRAYSVKSV